MDEQPSTNGSNGQRCASGRFQAGNAGGPGNPHAKRVALLRTTLLEAVTEQDLREIALMLVKKSKEGDLVATRELFDRLIGKSASSEDPQRFELDEKRLELFRKQVRILEDRALYGG